MRIDCHTHTACHSSCATHMPTELMELARMRSIDAVVITEHNYQWTPRDLAPLRQGFPELAIYGGVELTLTEGYDVVVISPGLPPKLPAYPSLDRLMRDIAPMREDTFCFVAHAFRYVSEINPVLSRILDCVDGMEMNSVNILRPGVRLTPDGYQPVNRDCYEEAARRWDPVPLWNTDAHHAPAVGAFATILDGVEPPGDEAGLARLLKTTRGRPWQNTQVLERYLEWR